MELATLPAIRLDSETRAVIREMDGCDDDFRRYVRALAADLGMPVERLRQILRRLSEQGLATYGPVADSDDGRPAGSTWWLTERGAALREQIGGAA